MIIKTAAYLQSSPDVKGCPKPDKPEFAFTGRSNVGKSSLINMLCGRKQLAHTSHSPGKTQAINHFLINDKYYLADLPGYGYAQRSKTMREQWQKNMLEYIEKRENLVCVFVLADISIKPQKIDLEFMEWMAQKQKAFTIIFTKADKISKAALKKSVNTYFEEMKKDWLFLPMHITTSSNTKRGLDDVWSYIIEYGG